MSWGSAVAWFAVIAACSFLVTWVVTDLLKIKRGTYIGVLAVVTGGLTYGTWPGAGPTPSDSSAITGCGAWPAPQLPLALTSRSSV
jgi:hypothetical protein